MKGRGTAGALLVFCGFGFAAVAQEPPAGPQARFDVTQQLRYSDNVDFDEDDDAESDLFGRTVLGFNLESVNSLSRVALNLGADIDEWREDQSTIDVSSYFGNLLYDRATTNASFGTFLSYREADVTSDFNEGDFDQSGNAINQDDGTRETIDTRVNAAVGLQDPIGASFEAAYREITFSDTDDPDLDDRRDYDILGEINFRFGPRVTTDLFASYSEVDTFGEGVDRETTRFGSVIGVDVTPTDRVDVSLSYDEIDRSGTETGSDDGFSAGIGWERLMPNGTLGATYDSLVSSNEDSRRSEFRVLRDMELPRGALAFAVGVTGADTVGTDPLIDIDYRYDLPTAILRFGVSQQVFTDTDNDEQINTRLSASYDQRINSVSSYGISFNFFDRNELQDNPNDGQRIDFAVSYRYDLTADWGLVSEYRYAFSEEDNDDEDRTSNTIF
ncbi:MAG: hypothetical protein AAGA28_19815, partial [Pseudomonadota bacterium]